MKNKFLLGGLLALVSTASFVNAQNDKKRVKSDAPQTTIVQIETIEKSLIVAPPPVEIPANGSLFTNNNSLLSNNSGGGSSLVSDFKARSVGDLVFIDVVEASRANVTSTAKRNRDSGALGGIGAVAGALPIPGAAIAGTVAGALGRRTFEGKGSTDRNSDLRARITARVVEVLPNGDLLVAGLKQVKINKEVEQVALSGIIRTVDVGADNSIPTTFIGDLRVELNGKGIASKDNAPGWLFRLFEKVTPF